MNQAVSYVVLGVTVFIFFFAALSAFNPSYDLMFILFMMGQLLVPYMVYVVLKHGIASEKKFEDSFYDDSSMERVKDRSEI
tara:strand:+ start:2017 stop:2259 length:243 start_codon:yes stop_codon:yes gene_type:complete